MQQQAAPAAARVEGEAARKRGAGAGEHVAERRAAQAVQSLARAGRGGQRATAGQAYRAAPHGVTATVLATSLEELE